MRNGRVAVSTLDTVSRACQIVALSLVVPGQLNGGQHAARDAGLSRVSGLGGLPRSRGQICAIS